MVMYESVETTRHTGKQESKEFETEQETGAERKSESKISRWTFVRPRLMDTASGSV